MSFGTINIDELDLEQWIPRVTTLIIRGNIPERVLTQIAKLIDITIYATAVSNPVAEVLNKIGDLHISSLDTGKDHWEIDLWGSDLNLLFTGDNRNISYMEKDAHGKPDIEHLRRFSVAYDGVSVATSLEHLSPSQREAIDKANAKKRSVSETVRLKRRPQGVSYVFAAVMLTLGFPLLLDTLVSPSRLSGRMTTLILTTMVIAFLIFRWYNAQLNTKLHRLEASEPPES